MNRIRLACPAKINLYLNVVGRRADGYHDIDTLFLAIDLHDTVTLTRIDSEFSVLKSEAHTIPFGQKNLCIKTFNIIKERFDIRQSLEIDLRKRIPLGSGLGGGSSDAASVIEGADRLFGLGLSLKEKMEVASQVGMDVPFFVLKGAARGRERGDCVAAFADKARPIWLLLAKGDTAVSTSEAYSWLDGMQMGRRKMPAKAFREALASGHVEKLGPLLYNTFEEAVFPRRPEIAEMRASLLEFGAAGALMSGSGASVYGLFKSIQGARSARARMRKRFGRIFLLVCQTARVP